MRSKSIVGTCAKAGIAAGLFCGALSVDLQRALAADKECDETGGGTSYGSGDYGNGNNDFKYGRDGKDGRDVQPKHSDSDETNNTSNSAPSGAPSGSSGSASGTDAEYPRAYIPESADHDGFKVPNPETGGDDGDDGGDTVDQPPADKQCTLFSGSLHKVGENIGDGNYKDAIRVNSSIKDSRCVSEFLEKLSNHARGEKGGRWEDDHYAAAVAEIVFGGVYDSPPRTPNTLPNGSICYQYDKRSHELKDSGGKGYICREGVWHFGIAPNGSCEYASAERVRSECGAKVVSGIAVNYIESSPISLLWREGTDIDALSKLAQFPLEPGSGRAFCDWRGSAEAPLLVYDPLHRGEIRSAEQLFGQWTFGGKRTASLADRGTGSQPAPWSNGYEALATLDADGNGEVSGSELAPIGLWFDANRDAVSQPGEVRSLSDAGVTALFYSPDSIDGINNHIHASKGFVRVENGKTIHGASVDWFAKTAATPGELMANHFFAQPSSSAQSWPDTIEVESSAGKSASEQQTVSGIWEWSYAAQGKHGDRSGYFVLSNSAGDNIVGYTLAPKRFAPSTAHALESQLSAFLVRGKRAGNTIRFESNQGGNRMTTEARLSSDGTILLGKSKVYFTENGRNTAWEYDWRAVRKEGATKEVARAR